MNTKAFEQFDVINEVDLSAVEGGYSAIDCRNAMLTGIASGIIAGGTGAGLATLGVGGLAGAFVGAHIGAIGGGLTCVGGMIGNKF
ncbi:Bacteriocin-like peptide J BlpJ [Streptococcus infantarius subsp. infantarius]|uniref:bacteriocin class II family protein n=1 Tax=Streptococcus infantarius TaxID=102684 RepID=UPI00208E90C5|nr:Bacteriocin-like peptide J BlpJ [Streptococcus infantarius subsp. infantarius]MCO4627797.1 Bacteriocin-like peptide J BlpJ [Streptococcus infantarius subsp. infantarius]MCO4691547.1 Bacteriocin-like peptide J BlpJ [Streptococcus infantarius subsp. infantarius]